VGVEVKGEGIKIMHGKTKASKSFIFIPYKISNEASDAKNNYYHCGGDKHYLYCINWVLAISIIYINLTNSSNAY